MHGFPTWFVQFQSQSFDWIIFCVLNCSTFSEICEQTSLRLKHGRIPVWILYRARCGKTAAPDLRRCIIAKLFALDHFKFQLQTSCLLQFKLISVTRRKYYRSDLNEFVPRLCSINKRIHDQCRVKSRVLVQRRFKGRDSCLVLFQKDWG